MELLSGRFPATSPKVPLPPLVSAMIQPPPVTNCWFGGDPPEQSIFASAEDSNTSASC